MEFTLNIRVFLLIGLYCVVPSRVYAQVLNPSTVQILEREQQERLQALEQSNQSLQTLIPAPLIPDSSSGTEEPSEQCIPLSELSFSGNTLYSDDELLRVVKFTSDCLTLTDINALLRVVSNHYIEAGYVTSRAFMEPQDLSAGTLVITVFEGRVEKVLLNGEPSTLLFHALPFINGSVLNLRDIEQGLDQINRLSRYNAQIQLLPSDKPGYSIVDIRTPVGALGGIGVGFNNGGQDSTGEEQLSLNMTGDNVFKFLDQWTLSVTKSAAFVDSKDSESAYLGVNIPFGYWNVGYRTSYSRYLTTFDSYGLTFDSSGRTNSHDADIKWLFYRDGESKSALKLGVHHRREKNYMLGSLLESSSRNLSSISLNWEHSTRLGRGFFTLSPSYHLGTDWFGGETNLSSASSYPKAQFSKGTLFVNYTYPVSPQLSLGSTAFGQWSNDTLYGNERLSIGGEHSVRGFKGSSLSGDEGYYWRNDVNYIWGQWPYIGRVSTHVGLDTGTIAKDSQDNFEGGSLLGSSMAIKTQGRHVSTALTLALPMASPSWLTHDHYVLYYQVNLSL